MAQIKMTRLRIKFGCLAKFMQVMENEILPIVTASGRQRLLAAYRTVTGPSYFEILHIWELEDANAHVAGLVDVSNPGFLKVNDLLRDLVEEEGSNLLLKTPYSP